MSFHLQFKQKSPFFLKRVKYFLSRFSGVRLQKAKSLHFVSMNGRSFKRLVLCDSYLASTIERNLETFRGSEHFPALVTCYEREIWVDFIDGLPIKVVDEEIVKKMADFYAMLYSRQFKYVDTTESPFPHRLQQDLLFLHHIGVLSDDLHSTLAEVAKRLIPQKILMGWDYSDPVLKNFVILKESGKVCAVDVEGLAENQLIGMGVAKACLRWLDPYRSLFFEHLAKQNVPDFQVSFPFIELCFLAKWTKRAFFEQKFKIIDPSLFERFRHL